MKNKIIKHIVVSIIIVALVFFMFYWNFNKSSNTPPIVSSEETGENTDYVPSMLMRNREKYQNAKNNNSNVMAWLEIAGTDIEAAVLQNDTVDSEEYFFDKDCYVDSIEYLSPNATIYNFDSLENYLDHDYTSKNNIITLTIQNYEIQYEIISVCFLNEDNKALFTKPNLTPNEFEEMVLLAYNESIHDTEVSKNESYNVITLISNLNENGQQIIIIGVMQ